MDLNILPCPYCGGRAITFSGCGLIWVSCCQCFAQTQSKQTLGLAIYAWNKRSDKGLADGIAQGRREAADDYCKECCCFSVCSEDANEKLYCQIRQNILGTASSEKIKES
jgi:basic membrane lipoprotein Med (substrate-binding protein (PBP1-ABC) superfamily)